jgi:hypothetical protein
MPPNQSCQPAPDRPLGAVLTHSVRRGCTHLVRRHGAPAWQKKNHTKRRRFGVYECMKRKIMVIIAVCASAIVIVLLLASGSGGGAGPATRSAWMVTYPVPASNSTTATQSVVAPQPK